MTNNSVWLYHNYGHLEILNWFIRFLNKNFESTINKKLCKKVLGKQIKISNYIIDELDKRYNYFENDEKMTDQDELLYHCHCGLECQALYLIAIINKFIYRDKNSYDKTDWSYMVGKRRVNYVE